MLKVAMGILILVICFLVPEIDVMPLAVALSTQILLGWFLRETFKREFEGIFFWFFMLPFDVGDRVEINGVQMMVEKIAILADAVMAAE